MNRSIVMRAGAVIFFGLSSLCPVTQVIDENCEPVVTISEEDDEYIIVSVALPDNDKYSIANILTSVNQASTFLAIKVEPSVHPLNNTNSSFELKKTYLLPLPFSVSPTFLDVKELGNEIRILLEKKPLLQ